MFLRSFSLITISCILFLTLAWNHILAKNVNTFNFPSSILFSYSDTTYKIIPSTADTYGYEILINGKALISQKNIPSISGSIGFKRKEDAVKTAKLVIKKLSAGILPPSIDKHELDSMKVKY